MEINILNRHGVVPVDVRKEKKNQPSLSTMHDRKPLHPEGWYGFQFDVRVFSINGDKPSPKATPSSMSDGTVSSSMSSVFQSNHVDEASPKATPSSRMVRFSVRSMPVSFNQWNVHLLSRHGIEPADAKKMHPADHLVPSTAGKKDPEWLA